MVIDLIMYLKKTVFHRIKRKLHFFISFHQKFTKFGLKQVCISSAILGAFNFQKKCRMGAENNICQTFTEISQNICRIRSAEIPIFCEKSLNLGKSLESQKKFDTEVSSVEGCIFQSLINVMICLEQRASRTFCILINFSND